MGDYTPAPGVSRTGSLIFDVTAYGGTYDGQVDDTGAVQRATNDMARILGNAGGSGELWWPKGAKTRVSSTITMPARGAYGYRGTGARPSPLTFNDGNPPPNPNASGIIITGNIGNQPTGAVVGLPGNLQTILDFTPAVSGEVTFRSENMLWYDPNGVRAVAAFEATPIYSLDWVSNFHQNVGVWFSGLNPGTQSLQKNFLRNAISGSTPGIYLINGSPFSGEIAGNVAIGEPSEGAMAGWGLKGTFFQGGLFFVMMIHHNYLQGGQINYTTVRAWIWVDTLSQPSLGSIDHNPIYGAASRAIHWQNNTVEVQPGSPSAGVIIDSNPIVGWNQSNIGGDTGAAIVVLTSTGVPPAQSVHIGTHQLIGGGPNGNGNHSLRGIQVDGNPDQNHVTIDPIQSMNHILTAPLRINGVDGYGKGTRSVADGATTNLSPQVTSATLALVDTDVGQPISGVGIPAGSYVGQVTNATTLQLSSTPSPHTPVNATATASNVTLTTGGTTHRLHGAFAAPAVPALGVPILNPAGFDLVVDITNAGVGGCGVNIDGALVATIPVSGIYSVMLPRGATIKFTTNVPASWAMRAA